MGFFESAKRKVKEAFTGESPGVQKYGGSGGRRVGSMGKYGGGAAGIDASTYNPDYKPRGHVSSLSNSGALGGEGYDAVSKTASVSPRKNPGGLGGFGAKVAGGAGKALDWMAERGNELNAPPKKRKARAPRMSKEDTLLENMYNPLMNERSAPRKSGGGGGGNWVSQGTIFSGGEAYEEVKPRPKRRKQKSKRARVYEDDDGDMMDMGHIPSSLRGMF